MSVPLISAIAPCVALFACYLWLASRTSWPWSRSGCFAAGLAVTVAGLAVDQISLPVHMAGHGVVVAVGAPLLVLGRPVTLLLRTLPRYAARDLAAGLRSPWVRRLCWPPLAFAAFAGVQLLFHLTPLFWSALDAGALEAVEHLLFIVTALWLWSVCLAVEPLPGRWSPWARAGLLMAAMSASDVGAIKLMIDGYGNAAVAMLASMLPLGLGAAAVAWTAIVKEEQKAQRREEIAHAAG